MVFIDLFLKLRWQQAAFPAAMISRHSLLHCEQGDGGRVWAVAIKTVEQTAWWTVAAKDLISSAVTDESYAGDLMTPPPHTHTVTL